jgi:glycosyltransferase involved in cell wall biosynthesis
MRVLHLYSGNLYGGIESILVALARNRHAVPGLDHEFGLCFGDGMLMAALSRTDAPVHTFEPVRFSRPLTVRAARRSMIDVIARRRIELVVCHAPWSHAVFAAPVRRAGLPLVFWAHDAMTGGHWTERLARRTAPDLVIANSRFTAGTVDTVFPAVPVAVVYAPVERPSPIAPADRQRLRASLQTASTDIVVIQASRSEPWKGHALLLEALAELAPVPGWVWWQVGGAQRPAEAVFLESIRREAVQAGIADRVRWAGQRTDVAQLLASADIYCQVNSRAEPFGVVFVEALGAGLPVVTTALGGAREIVDATCGVLVTPGDAAGLVGALRTLIVDRHQRLALAAAGPARAAALCDPASQARQLSAALEQISEMARA